MILPHSLCIVIDLILGWSSLIHLLLYFPLWNKFISNWNLILTHWDWITTTWSWLMTGQISPRLLPELPHSCPCLIIEKNVSNFALYPSLLGFTLLRRIAPLAGALMLNTSLLINDLTCLLGNAMWLVVLCCLSALRARTWFHCS